MVLKINQIHQGDCLDLMPLIPDASVDMILCDLPYGITACDWDTPIDPDRLWEQYKRIVKPKAAIVLTGSQPFTSKLVMSNLKWFKYEWIWEKNCPTGFANADYMPMKNHESVLIFCSLKTKFNKQLTRTLINDRETKNGKINCIVGTANLDRTTGMKNVIGKVIELKENVNPRTVVKFSVEPHSQGLFHPTQKPVKLFEYLIRTYTDEGDLVLDNCIGSGSTAVAALNTGRNFIGIELSPEYCEIARKRVINTKKRKKGLFSIRERNQMIQGKSIKTRKGLFSK